MILSCTKWEPVTEYKGLLPRVPRAAMVIHTNGAGVIGDSDEDLHDWWVSVALGKRLPRVGKTVGAQFQVARDGSGYQYVDTDLVVSHAFGASLWAVGVETEDDGNPSLPFTDAQINKIVAIGMELKVPGQLLKETSSDGVGWHQMWGSWNQNNHNCPGVTRVIQIQDVIIPRLKLGGFLMSLSDEEQQELLDNTAYSRNAWKGLGKKFGFDPDKAGFYNDTGDKLGEILLDIQAKTNGA